MSLTNEEKALLREFIASGEYQLNPQPTMTQPNQFISEAMGRIGNLQPDEVRALLEAYKKNKELNIQIGELARKRINIVI